MFTIFQTLFTIVPNIVYNYAKYREGSINMENLVVCQITKLIEDWIPKEASVAIAVDNKYLDYYAGLHDIEIRPGQPIPTGSISERVFHRQGRVETFIDDSVFGISYYGIGYPVIGREGNAGVLTVILPPRYSLKKQTPLSFLIGKQGEFWTPIPVDQITHIEGNQKKTWFYTTAGQYTTNYTLKYLEEKLPDSFLRIHRSYIVNLSFINQIYRDIHSNLKVKLKSPEFSALTISQTYIPRVRQTLGF